ncbi:proline-rich receptor-like protein kinase PERK10 [Nasonia vitripennis]|uniref:Uncharacterized protein n=1 Tax=Nasonia vitripennis TaxID=7425 RepID=A0A7M7Q093_NASVI|nr:proline-rich receptor-like protein kinase PERK10 [Nasonia vitripennis]
MPRPSYAALRAELELTRLYLTQAHRAGVLERQRRPPPGVDAATQTEPTSAHQDCATQVDWPPLAPPPSPPQQPAPEPAVDVICAEWPEHLELVDTSARPASPDLRALLAAPPTDPPPAALPRLSIISRKIAAGQAARPESRKVLLVSPTKRKASPSPAVRKRTAPQKPGIPKPKIVRNELLRTPLRLPPRKKVAHAPHPPVSLAEGKIAEAAIDLTITD